MMRYRIALLERKILIMRGDGDLIYNRSYSHFRLVYRPVNQIYLYLTFRIWRAIVLLPSLDYPESAAPEGH